MTLSHGPEHVPSSVPGRSGAVSSGARGETSRALGEPCPKCRGRGWVLEEDGGAGRASPCSCREEERGLLLLRNSGIPERYRACRLGTFETRHANAKVRNLLLKARVTCERYVDEFLDVKTGAPRESGLVLIGPPGAGKTHLAAAVLSEILKRYHVRGRFVDFTSLLHQIRSSFDPQSPETHHQVLDPVVGAEVLVLDELGAQKPTDWVMDVLYLIINTRYTQRRPTIFTTNYRLDGSGDDSKRFESLSTRISPLLVSRLFEMARPIELGGWDYRRDVKKYRLDPGH